MCLPYVVVAFACMLASCAVNNKVAVPPKYAAAQLQEDLDVAWKTYQEIHPSYDWYTPRDTVDARFAKVRTSITDSLTEAEFRLRLAYAVASINCGHTSVSSSKKFQQNARGGRGMSFPLDLQVLPGDSLVVTGNRFRDSGVLVRGDVVLSINDVPAQKFLEQMRQYISSDGYNTTFKDEMISRSFASRFKWLYGLPPHYIIRYTDSTGKESIARLKNFTPKRDTTRIRQADSSRARPPQPARGSRKPWRLTFDSTHTIAYMQLNSFSGWGLQRFFRRSFKTIKRDSIHHVIIDVRYNGGGNIDNFVALSRYVADKPFTIGDSVSARSLKFPYPTRVKFWWFYKMFGWTMVHRESDGRLHMGMNERQLYEPRKRLHFDENLYVLTGGTSFSATILFLHSIQHRSNTTTIGEETGGGARGNSAVMTPDIRLPNTKVLLRLPLFRLVTDHSLPENGHGIYPGMYAPVTSHAVRYRYSPAIEVTKELIRNKQAEKR